MTTKISKNIVRKDVQASCEKPQGGAFPGLANSQAPRPPQGPRFLSIFSHCRPWLVCRLTPLTALREPLQSSLMADHVQRKQRSCLISLVTQTTPHVSLRLHCVT